MALRTVITQRQRRLGAELRKLRLEAGLSIAEGGKLIEMGPPHLSHIEAGRTAIPADKLRALARAYGCTNEPYIDALARMSESDGKGWWSECRKVFPQSTLDLAELESQSTTIQTYETLIIPGLLQTESYMRALFQSGRSEPAPEAVENLVRFRMARQRVLTTGSVAFHAVIHESALRMGVGSSQVMREQLIHLARASMLPNMTVQVLPFEAGVCAAWFSTPFLLLGNDIPGLETVVAEHPSALLRLDDTKSVAQYAATMERLSAYALPPVEPNGSPELHEQRDSLGLIQHILYTH